MTTRWRALAVSVFGVLLAGGLLIAATSGSQPVAVATAADLSQFDAGNIIDDDVFFDSDAMSATTIQAFLTAKGVNCTAGSLCLKKYTLTTSTKAADAYCTKKYAGASKETAATIISKVATACGINPQALLVLLQKEQGLVTATAPTASRYKIATGFGCPDTAACDTQYYGFFNQLYTAAHQFQRYSVLKTYKYRAGITNTILYSPTTSCGSSKVFIDNQATAALYNYTPYQPNKAALAAGYGSGNSCSAYGNRNFYNYFTDWFGSTHSAGGAAIAALYGKTSSTLGAISTNVVCGLTGGGCYQDYAKGSVYWTKKTGAHYVLTSLRTKFLAVGGVAGDLGYPTGNTVCVSTGCSQVFAGGAVYRAASATKAFVSSGTIYAKYVALRGPASSLGYPIKDTTCGLRNDGCWQKFTGGRIYYQKSAGTHWLSNGDVLAAWQAASWEKGDLLYPTTDISTTSDKKATFVDFQGGSIYALPSLGSTRVLLPSVVSAWNATGRGAGSLGYPTGNLVTASDGKGKLQQFQTGAVVWSSATGWHAIGGAIYARWTADGGVSSALSYPTSNVIASGSGTYASFSGGRLFWTAAGGAHQVSGAVYTAWTAAGGVTGTLGYPLTDAVSAATGVSAAKSATGSVLQQFQAGVVWTSSKGTYAVGGEVYKKWIALKGAKGSLGAPTSNLVTTTGTTGQYATFAGGVVASSTSTGAHSLGSAIGTKWLQLGAQKSALKYPTSDQASISDGKGSYASFSGGRIYSTTKTGTHWVGTTIAAKWKTLSWQAGVLGYPTTDQKVTPDGTGSYVHFQGGSIYRTAKTGAHWIGTTLQAKWSSLKWERGVLGYPTSDQKATADGKGSYVTFQHGSIYRTAATGAHWMGTSVTKIWKKAGAERSKLKYPTADQKKSASGKSDVVRFQGGSITYTTKTGKYSLVTK